MHVINWLDHSHLSNSPILHGNLDTLHQSKCFNTFPFVTQLMHTNDAFRHTNDALIIEMRWLKPYHTAPTFVTFLRDCYVADEAFSSQFYLLYGDKRVFYWFEGLFKR